MGAAGGGDGVGVGGDGTGGGAGVAGGDEESGAARWNEERIGLRNAVS